jgi:glycerol-3-phosphate acyltransferase PlsY
VDQVVAIIVAYLLGSVSFGIVVSSFQGVDIRSVGSGNTGTSNIMRNLGKKSAALVLLGDGLKGALAAAIGTVWIGDDFGWVTLLAAIVGHSYPMWHSFRGGKSVATAIGGIAVLAPWVGGVLAVVWIAALLVWKTASIGSLVAMVLLVPLVIVSGASTAGIVWSAVIAVFIVVRHGSNIRRLVSASEHKVAE